MSDEDTAPDEAPSSESCRNMISLVLRPVVCRGVRFLKLDSYTFVNGDLNQHSKNLTLKTKSSNTLE